MAALIAAIAAIGAGVALLVRRLTRSGETEASVKGDQPGRDRG